MDSSPVIALDKVSRAYDGGRVVALDGVTLHIARGELVSIMGPSGSGKSTLLNLASGLDRPTQGRVVFEGVEPRSRNEWARLRARRLGYVFQTFNLLATLSARQNVELAMFGVVPSARERARRAQVLLERAGLAGRATHRPHELSVGERQRVAIARSLANAPVVIFADEPTGNLDSASASSILELLLEIHAREGTTLVIVTHDAGIAGRTPRQVRLKDGRVDIDERR